MTSVAIVTSGTLEQEELDNWHVCAMTSWTWRQHSPLLEEVGDLAEVLLAVLALHVHQHAVRPRLNRNMQKAVHALVTQNLRHFLPQDSSFLENKSIFTLLCRRPRGVPGCRVGWSCRIAASLPQESPPLVSIATAAASHQCRGRTLPGPLTSARFQHNPLEIYWKFNTGIMLNNVIALWWPPAKDWRARSTISSIS